MSAWRKLFFLLLMIAYLLFFVLFFLKYVPLIPGFLLILLPALAFLTAAAAHRPEQGILFFVFAFPLLNNLPYFFGVELETPHAPVALVLFLAFFLGWLIKNSLSPEKLDLRPPLFRPLIILTVMASISGLITFYRFTNFYPFLSDRIYELIVNSNGVRAGGARMSCLLSLMNLLSGFFFFAIVSTYVKTEEFRKRILTLLSGAALVAFLFAFLQKFHSLRLGNTLFFTNLERLNATFKDPNSFGLFLAAFLPILLGLSLSSRGRQRYLSAGLLALGLIIFPWVGSRSALLGLCVALLLIAAHALKNARLIGKKRPVVMALILLSFLSLCILSIVLSPKTTLYQRLSTDVRGVLHPSSASQLAIDPRVRFWIIALAMIRDFPFSGVGLGSYIIELPNYSSKLGYMDSSTDTAENYFFQVGAELGLAGLITAVWVLFEIFVLMKRNWSVPRGESKDSFLRIGLVAGVAAVFVNFFFHSYVGSFDVIFLFWLLVALLGVQVKPPGEMGRTVRDRRNFRYAVFFMAVVYGGTLAWNSARTLAIAKRTEEFGWVQNFGLYEQEKDDQGRFFQWTQKTAGITLENLRQPLVIPIRASHPDIRRRPVEVKIFLADENFKKIRRLGILNLDSPRWFQPEYSFRDNEEKRIHILFETSRDWSPRKELGVSDPRRLAIALGEYDFRILPSDSSRFLEAGKNIQRFIQRENFSPQTLARYFLQ